MKKFLLSLIAMLAIVTNVKAGEEVLQVNSAAFWGVSAPKSGAGTYLVSASSPEKSVTQGAVTIVTHKGDAGTASCVWNTNDNLTFRTYNKSTFNIQCTSNITSIVIEGVKGKMPLAYNGEAGSISTGETTITWTGSSTDVEFAATGTCQINSITVTYAGGGSDPVAVEGVSLTDGSGNALGMYTQMTVSETMQLKAVVTPSNATNKKVTWEVMQNEEVISFDEATGKVKALKAGQAAVVATTEDGEKQAATTFVVSDTQDGTIADFIAAGGKTCYLTGVVSNIQNTTYGNFDLTDESGTIYVYGCLTPAGESKKFAELGISEGDKIKVLASTYEFYKGETHEAKNVIFVENYGKPATYSFEINAGAENFTVTPSDATVMYLIDVLPEGIFEKYEIDDIDGYYDDMIEEYGSGLEYYKGVQTQSYEEDWWIDEDGVYEIRVFAVSPEYKRISEITMVKTPLVTSIQEIKTNDGKVVRINLAGQQVGANAKGIVIMNGKKVLVK